ncbi:MAG: hypothetical protein IT199_03040 [Solirubrobacterales bacterium]|nr:hypothetical protein [Solirubrobacterales bacterium]
MPEKTFPVAGRRTIIAAALGGLIALLCGLAVLNGPANRADAAPGQAVVLGAANANRVPLCPERCSGLAIVSGFQAKASGQGNAFRVPFVGRITRWRLSLGDPTASQRQFFQRRFGNQPQAAIGVLAKVVRDGRITYKLRRRTALQGLNRFMGRTATFNLPRPMNVNKGDYISLIVPTWAPALAVPPACQIVNGAMANPDVCNRFNRGNSWVASRNRSTCSQTPSMNNSQAQIKVNSYFPYGCRFNGALTYRVRVESR